MANITCVKCRRVCAHRNMFNSFYDCREGCVRCVLYFLFFFFFFFYDTVMYAVHVCKQQGVYSVTCLHVGSLCVYVYTARVQTPCTKAYPCAQIRVHTFGFLGFFFTINLLGFFCFFFYVMLMISVVFYSLWLFSRMSRESPFPDIQRCIFLCSSFCFLNLRVQKDVTFSQTKKKNRGKLQFRGFLWTFLTFNLMAFYRFHIYLVNPPTLPLHLTIFVVL